MRLQIGEVFGHGVGNLGDSAQRCRRQKFCPFKDGPCTKASRKDPLGICSFTDGEQGTVVCPTRFLDSGEIFRDAARLAFGDGIAVAAVPEVRVLRVPGKNAKIGKIDFMLAALDEQQAPVDFAALEIQAVYISGDSIRPAFNHFLRFGKLQGVDSLRRPDFRSSAQKRLMPQLALKVPIFRRWGKKFFVAVDETFFNELPQMAEVDGIENSEVSWLVYRFERNGDDYRMKLARTLHTQWDEVVSALREGVAPKPSEMLKELRLGLGRATIVIP